MLGFWTIVRNQDVILSRMGWPRWSCLMTLAIFLSFSGSHGGKRWAGEVMWAEHLHKTLPCRDNQEASLHGMLTPQ